MIEGWVAHLSILRLMIFSDPLLDPLLVSMPLPFPFVDAGSPLVDDVGE